MFSHPEASSTSYLIYKVVEALWGAESVTARQAEVLYVGMMTDTGNFSFSTLTPDLYQSLAVLCATGINIPQIYNNVYNSFTEGRARLFGYTINRKMRTLRKGTVAHMSLTEEEMDAPNYVSDVSAEDLGETVVDEEELEDSYHEATDEELADAFFSSVAPDLDSDEL